MAWSGQPHKARSFPRAGLVSDRKRPAGASPAKFPPMPTLRLQFEKEAEAALGLPPNVHSYALALHNKSLRPQHTVEPLAELVGREKLRLDFSEGEEQQLVGCFGCGRGGPYLLAPRSYTRD
jgi:hypothetical protein